MSGWQTVMAERIIAVLVITREFTCGVDGDGDGDNDGDGDGEEWQWRWMVIAVMMTAHCYDDTTNVQTNPWEVRHPASEDSSKGVTDPDNLQKIVFKWTFQWKNVQHYRHKERSICNWDSSDYGHVGEVDKGGVEPDHGEGVGDANEEEEGVRQQLEVHHLLENSEHPSVWGGGKELGDQVSSSL